RACSYIEPRGRSLPPLASMWSAACEGSARSDPNCLDSSDRRRRGHHVWPRIADRFRDHDEKQQPEMRELDPAGIDKVGHHRKQFDRENAPRANRVFAPHALQQMQGGIDKDQKYPIADPTRLELQLQ